MAETTEKLKPTKVKYKFGADELDLLDYIDNLNHNVQDYLDHQKWNDGLKEEFKRAYNNYITAYQDLLKSNSGRLWTDLFGDIQDTLEEFSNKDNDDIDPVGSEYYYDNNGNRITTDDYNALKKRKQKNYNIFQANHEVSIFFNTVGRALAKARRTTASTDDILKKFNLSDNGFERLWLNYNNPSGEDFDYAPYVEKDKLDENGVRGTSERAKYLRELLLDYLNNLEDFDYSGSPFKDRDTYTKRIQAAIDNLADGYNSKDTIALQLAGLSSKFLNNFFANGATKPKTEVEEAAEYIKNDEQRKEDEVVIKEAERRKLLNAADKYFTSYFKEHPYIAKDPISLKPTPFNEDAIGEYILKTNNINKEASNYDLLVKNAIKQYVRFPFLVDLIRGNKKHYDKDGKDITAEHIANNLKYASKNNLFLGKELGDTGYYIIPNSEDYNNYTFLAYKPGDEPIILEYSMYLNENLSDELNKELRKRMAYKAYEKNNQVLKKLEGGTVNYFTKVRELALKDRQKLAEIKLEAKETNKSEEQVAAGYRKPSKTGWTAAENARIASAIMDIGSIISSFIPGYGTVASAGLGLASTGTNFFADLNDDSMSGWDVAKNAGLGIVMDVAGVIPGLGAIKTGKIARTLRALAPTLIAIWGAYLNGSAPIEAMNKLISEKDLTVNDWQALSAGLSMLAGGAGYMRGKRAIKGATSLKEVADVKTDTGSMATISREDFDKLKATKGFLELNKMFSDLTEGQHLQREFKNRELKLKLWNSRLRSQHPDYKTRTEYTLLPEDNSWDARLFKWLNNSKSSLKPINKKSQKSTSKTNTTSTALVPVNSKQFDIFDSNAARVDKLAAELRAEIANKRWEAIKNVNDEHGTWVNKEKTRPGTRTSSGELETINADQIRFVNNFFGNIPTMMPTRSSVSTPNLPAVIPKLLFKSLPSQSSPFNSSKINEGLDRAKKWRLQKDAENKKLSSTLNPNITLITEPTNISLVPKTSKKPTLAEHNKKLALLEKIWTPTEEAPKEMTKSSKGEQRAKYKKARELAEEKQRLVNELPYMSEKKKRKMVKETLLKRLDKPGRNYNNTKFNEKKPKKTSKEVSIKRRKEGGTLDLNKVRKFDIGGGITDVANQMTLSALNNNFFTNLYKLKKLIKWDSSKDDSKAGGSLTNENSMHGNAEDLSTAAYKNMIYTGNSNLVGLDLQSYYNSTFKGKSLQDYVNAYNSNAAKIRGFWDLERTYNDLGAAEHNRLFRAMFSNRSDNSNLPYSIGYDSNPEVENIIGSSTWLRRMDRYEKKFEDLSDEEKKARIHKIDLGNGNVGYVYKKANGDIGIWNPTVNSNETLAKPTVPTKPTTKTTTTTGTRSQLGGSEDTKNLDILSIKTIPQILSEGINENPTAAYGLIRAMLLDRANRRMTDMAKESMNPFLKDPFGVHRYTRSDLDAEMLGERNYAGLKWLASRPITSDGNLLTAALLQAEVQGLAARTAGKEKSNLTLRLYDELAWLQEKENAANRHETAMFNRAQLWGALLNKAKLDWAYLSKRANIWDTFALQLEYEAKVKLKEKKAIADKFALSDISQEATNNLSKYAPELSAEALDVWYQVTSGNTTPSYLLKTNPAKWLLYQLAWKAQRLVETDLLRQHYGVGPSPFGRVRLFNTAYTPDILPEPKFKKGGKVDSQIAVAGIKAKTADAERFQRQIKECIDRNEKAIDRLSKSLYGIIKASILK